MKTCQASVEHTQPEGARVPERSDLVGRALAGDRSGSLLEQDVDEELRRQMLSYGYRHDPQTGLLNRQGFQGSLGELLQQQEEGDEVALIWIDLINLRREFFLWGWDGIDALVGHVASTLQDVVGSDALLGRCTGPQLPDRRAGREV